MELLYAAVLIGLGIYNWKLTNKLNEYNDLIVAMAIELEQLGSPNIKIDRE